MIIKPEEALRRMRCWSKGAHPPPGPERISIFLTNKCNLHCRHCWRNWADWDRSGNSELPDERWLHLVDEAAGIGTRHWIFLGGGEPLVRGDLVGGMLDKMAAHSMTSWIHTNGTLFKPELIDKVLNTGVQEIIVSIDGPDAETNNYIRGKGFERAIAAVREITAARQKRQQSAPGFFLNTTLTQLTYDKLDRFVDLAASIGPGVKVELSALIIEDDETARLALNREQKAALPEMLHRGMQRARELGVTVNFGRFLNEEILEGNLNLQQDMLPETSTGLSGALCYEPWLSAAILPDGSLGPCCAFFDPKSLSIRDLSLEEVWMGAYMQDVRENMFTETPPGYCVRCPSNLFYDKERMRILLTEHLRRDQEPAALRALDAARRGLSVLVKDGPGAFTRKLGEWSRIHLKK